MDSLLWLIDGSLSTILRRLAFPQDHLYEPHLPQSLNLALQTMKINQIPAAKACKAKPTNEHQGRMALYVDGLRVPALILKQEMLVVAIVETTYFCVDLAKFAQSSAITPKLRKYREK